MKPTNAARLRDMAQVVQEEASKYKRYNCGQRFDHLTSDAAALLAGAKALDACARLRAFADELTAQNMPVLHGMAYQIDRLLPKKEKSDG